MRSIEGVSSLGAEQRALVEELRDGLAGLRNVEAVCLGGSHARGRARADSDIDLGIYYSESAPFDLEALRLLCQGWHDGPAPIVSEPFEWGPWVNGGAWLSVRGQRVDLLYRSLEHVERVIEDARQGRFEIHFLQQPPYGFFGPIYLGELAVAKPLFDPRRRLAELAGRVVPYPEPLRGAVVQELLWSVEFGAGAFARKLAARGDVYGTAGCLARFAHQLVLVLFALNRHYLVNEKTALEEIEAFPLAPAHFRSRIEELLAAPGRSPEALAAALARLEALFQETAELAGNLYRSRTGPPDGVRRRT